MSDSTSQTQDFGTDDGAVDLAQALTALRPSAATIDRDRLMFLAGRATAEREMAHGGLAQPAAVAVGLGRGGLAGQVLPGRGDRLSRWLWPSATAAATVAAGVLGLLLAISHRPQVIRETVYVHAEPTTQAPGTTPTTAPSAEQPEALVAPPLGAADAVTAHVASGKGVDVGRIDLAPRTSLPPSNYVHSRQIALSLGVEALGSGTPSGGDEHPVAYRERLDEIMSDAESR